MSAVPSLHPDVSDLSALVARLRELFPGAQVTPRVDKSEGESFESFDILRGDEAILRVYPAGGVASAIEIHSDKYVLEGGLAVGSAFEELERKRGPVECFGGAEENAGKAFCSSASQPGLVFVFPLHDPRGELYATPLDGDRRAALAGQSIAFIIWSPEAPVGEPEPPPPGAVPERSGEAGP